MAWYRNHNECDRCGGEWTDEWSCMCDDDCPDCGARHLSPYDSDDLTEIVVPSGGSRSAWSRKAAACDAMPAASSNTSQAVTEKRCRNGIRTRPR